jgi:hypothetical protein
MVNSPKLAVAFMKDRLKAAPAADPKRIEKCIVDLDSSDFKSREKAAQELENYGVLAAPILEKKLLQKNSIEVERRLETLLAKIDDKAMSAEELRGVRAITALEAIGTPEAQTVLQGLAKGGAGALSTEQSREALSRLAKRAASK